MSSASVPARTPSAIDAIADRFLDVSVAHDPIMATGIGVPGHDHELPALDPSWYQERSDLRRRVLTALAAAEATDSRDRITVAALTEHLEADEDLRAIGAEESDLKNIDSPLQRVRDAFDLMATDTEQDWAVIATRLAAVPRALDGYVSSLRHAAANGEVRALRQVRLGVTDCERNVGADGFFATFARSASTDAGELPAALRAELDRAAAAAAAAYGALGEFLRAELAPAAADVDMVGRERYAVHSRGFIGARIDLDETYEWGQDELARITTEMERTADKIKPGASVREAMHHLDADPQRTLSGTDALQRWMQRTADDAVSALSGTHFDIPEPIRRIECRIAPTQSGGIYYTGPSEDLVTRPGRMWWSVPEGVTEFTTWSQLSTVYHEGVPGHHLQIAQTAYRSDVLNRWLRLAAWVNAHGEGWALYSERLMGDLGFLDDPGDYLGMLNAQSMRAARVVLDIGIHCDLPAPDDVGGGRWTYDKAWEFLGRHANSAEGFRRFELHRYLGWPGQAPSYKVGERLWLRLRDEVQAAAGASFDLASFHRRALDVGSVGMDVLRNAVLGNFD